MLFDPTAALASWLASTLTGLSVAIWGGVLPLAGGAEGPLWRWVLVEQGLFLLWLFIATWWTRMVLGLGRVRRTPQHYGSAAVFACIFSLGWNWYHLTATYAISLGAHPVHGWEWTFFTWGLPLLVAGSVAPAAALVVKLGVALALAAGTILSLGRLWADMPGLPRKRPPEARRGRPASPWPRGRAPAR